MEHHLRRLVLVRHGETAGQSSIRYYGATDIPLSDSGRWQMQQVHAALQAERFDAVYTSALQRTIAGARIIAPHMQPQPVAAFNEINFGQWEGLTREEIEARDPARFLQWRDGLSRFTYPGGDAVPAFRARVAVAWRTLLPQLPAGALLVLHKGVIATVIAELIDPTRGERTAWRIDLASIHVLVADGGEWHAEVMNGIAHLGGQP